MTKALKTAQTALDTLRDELEAWITSQPSQPVSVPVQRTRKPAVKRTRTELVASATTTPVAPVAPVQEIDTAWLDLVYQPQPQATETQPQPHVDEPQPHVEVPLYVDATAHVQIDLMPEPVPVPIRTPKKKPRTLRQAIREGDYGK